MPAAPLALPIIRTSERRDFKRCPQRWWWTWREGLRPNETARALWFGTGIHLALEHFYAPGGLKRGRNPIKVWRDYAADDGAVTMPSGQVNDVTGTPEYVEALRLGEDMLSGYFDCYGKDPHVFVLAVEKDFQLQIPARTGGGFACIYTGKWDLLWRDERDNALWLSDHKTARDLSVKHLTLDDQAGSYWALAGQYLRAHELIGPKENLKGIEYNILRKYSPPMDDRPIDQDGNRLNKDGTISKRQPKGMDYRYLRERVHRTARERQSQIKRIAVEAESMDRMRHDPELLYKNPTQDCTWDCSHFLMCELHERQADYQDYKALAYHVEDPYADHREAVSS